MLKKLFVAIASCNLFLHSAVHAQIATDGSVGAAQVLVGPNYTIPQTLGTVSGGNLFHSFDRFNINAGQSANFTTTSALNNVISRVTGGTASNINGQLRLTAGIGAPDFYFINPAGVVFGAGASLNVPGAFHVGTADYIAFPDGEFHADLGNSSTLSTAAPEAFGFLGTQNNDLVVKNGANLSLSNGDTLSLVGGDIEINNARVRNLNGGDLRVAAVGLTATEIAFTGSMADTSGDLAVLNGGRVYTETSGAADAGDVTVMAGDITIDDQGGSASGTYIGTGNTSTSTGGSGGAVDITATGNVDILGGGQINANTYAAGDSGSISVTADDIYIDNQTSSAWYTGILSYSDSAATGDAQGATIDASGTVSVVNGSEISSNTYGSGDAGWISITADDLLVDGQGSTYFTGLGSNVQSGATGSASGVDVDVNDVLIYEGGQILSNTWGNGDAGSVLISADSITMNDWGSTLVTGILSNAELGSTGDAGLVSVQATGDLDVLYGAEIGSNTFAVGDAGTVLVEAGNILLDGDGASGFTGIASNADSSSTGEAGLVSVTASGLLQVLDGSEIASNAFGAGDAGLVLVEADTIVINRDGNSGFTGIASDSAATSLGSGGIVSVTAHDSLFIENGGEIASRTFGVGDAGNVFVETGDLMVDGQGTSLFTGITSAAEIGSSGNAGTVVVTATGDVTVQDGGAIVSNTRDVGDAGTVSLEAGSLSIDGMASALFTGVGTNAESGSSGNAGNVTVTVAGDIALDDGAQIVSNTNGAGDAGYVSVTAEDIRADGDGSSQLTGIATIADTSSTGDAGIVTVEANDIRLVEGAVIASDTRSSGDAGYVDVAADNVYIEGVNISGDSSGITSSTRDTGTAGGVFLAVSDKLELVNGGVVSSDNWSTGDAGTVVVTAGNIVIDDQEGSTWTGISSDTVGASGDAGTVSVIADNTIHLVNDGAISSSTYGTGDAGQVTVKANAISLLNGGLIGSDNTSTGTGDAGSVSVTASTLYIDTQGGGWTGISSDTLGASGDAGDVSVSASNSLVMVNDATISSDTSGTGVAGDVRVTAGAITLGSDSTISAQAQTGSSGQTGNVTVSAVQGLSMSGDADISIENNATVATPSLLTPTTLTVTSPVINLSNADITANSTGNINASNIVVQFGDSLRMDSVSGITTSANSGNGGAISILGGDLLRLQDSQISTSVSGLLGNGGNIDVQAQTLIMQTGFIQANTAALNASGGDVTVKIDNLFASNNTLYEGGKNAYTFQPGVPGFNVIQAVSETGVSGVIDISTPVVDLTGTMAALTGNIVDTGGLGRSPCQVNSGSSLAPTGRGGLPASASDLASAESGSTVSTAKAAFRLLPDTAQYAVAADAGCLFL